MASEQNAGVDVLPLAARRDASFFNYPGRATQYHAIVRRKDGSTGPACGIAHHDAGTEEPASGLLNTEKCGRSGCRQAFARVQGG